MDRRPDDSLTFNPELSREAKDAPGRARDGVKPGIGGARSAGEGFPVPQATFSSKVVWLRPWEVREHLGGRDYRQVDRILSSFRDRDTILLSTLPPAAFARAGARPLRGPNLLLHVADLDEWIAVDDVQVGYWGSGPAAARDVLANELGMTDEGLVDAIAYSRVSIVDPNGPREDWVHSDNCPYVRVPSFTLDPTGYAISTVEVDDLPPGDADATAEAARRAHRGPSPNDFYPSSGLRRWMRFLEGRQLPPGARVPGWLEGPRRARIFLDSQEAIRQGFQWRGDSRATPNIVIEQGGLQIWVRAWSPTADSQWLSDQAYRALMLANVAGPQADGARRFKMVAARDAQNVVWRWVRSQVEVRPLVLDIGGPLEHAPSEPPYVRRGSWLGGRRRYLWNP